MSGHSKWSKIKHKKGAADAARSGSFTKLLKAVTIAAQHGGGDPDMNFSLRLAVEKAKAGNVPKDNIERAIKRGLGEDKDGAAFEEVLYEAFGPGGAALLIECVTDNKNRTVTDVKTMLSKNGGSMAGQGSVQWQFERLGAVRLTDETRANIKEKDEFELALIEAGASDIFEEEDHTEIRCPVERFAAVLDAVKTFSIEPDDSGLEWFAKESVSLSAEDAGKVEHLIDILEENDDVDSVYTNVV